MPQTLTDSSPAPAARLPALLSAYSALSRRDRLHLSVRYWVCPLHAIADYVPQKGVIVDVGCGHGLFAQLLCRQSKERRIIGFDLDPHKIGIAAQLCAPGGGFTNLEFRIEDAAQAQVPPAQAVTILDVLYLIPYAAQEKLLADCVAKLAPGGVLLLKEIAERPRWKYWANWLEESLMVRVLGLTAGRDRFYFRTRAGWQTLLRNLGLEVTTRELDRGYYHAHILFVGRKAAQ